MDIQKKKIAQFVRIFAINKVRSYFYLVVLTLLIQQIVVASSSVWVNKFSKNLQVGSFDKQNLALFCLSLLFPYIPGAFCLRALKKWEISSLSRFWETNINLLQNRIQLWNDKNKKNTLSALMAKDGPSLVSESTRFSYDLLSSCLNVFLNLIVITSLFDAKLLVSFLAGGAILVIGTYFSKSKNEIAAREYEKEKNNLSGWIHVMWDNVTIGNVENLNFWKSVFNFNKTILNRKMLRFCFTQEIISTIISMAAFVPTVFVILLYCNEKAGHPQDLVPFVVLFPRIFVLLNMVTSLVFLFRSYYGFRGRWMFVLNEMNFTQLEDFSKRIDLSKIRVDQHNTVFKNPDEFVSLVKTKNQRITLRGQNGAGKSTLLLWLKNHIGDDCYYLPSMNNLSFQDNENRNSTGQKTKNQIAEILKNSQAKIILLDEWDANMDAINISEISKHIDEICLSKTVVEVRHR